MIPSTIPPPASPAPKTLGVIGMQQPFPPVSESDKENAPQSIQHQQQQQTPARKEHTAVLLHKPLLGTSGTPARSVAAPSLLSSTSTSAAGSKRPLSMLLGNTNVNSHGSLSVVKKLGALGLGKAQRVTASSTAIPDEEDLMPLLPTIPPPNQPPIQPTQSNDAASTTTAVVVAATSPPPPMPTPAAVEPPASVVPVGVVPPMPSAPAPAPIKLSLRTSSNANGDAAPIPRLMSTKPIVMATNAAASIPPAAAAAAAAVVSPGSASAAAPIAPVAVVPAASPSPAVNPASLIVKSDIPVRHSWGFQLGGDRYSKLAQIGKGGSSVVYKVVSSKGSILALKELVLPPEDGNNNGTNGAAGDAHVPDYITEVANLSLMSGNPHVIQLVHAQEDTINRKVYVLMECGSCDLEKHLQQCRADMALTEHSSLLPSYTVQSLFSCMVRCVAAIHMKGIIHTDLKPVNFVFSASGTLKLIDFGIAKSIDVDSGATSAIYDRAVGTLNYMSPEALLAEEGAKIRSSADVWSLGCILYSLVYGEAPFARWTQAPAKMSRILDTREKIHFPDNITIIEEILSNEQEQNNNKNKNSKNSIKGNGIHVSIVAPAQGSAPDIQGTVTITRTYPSMPLHLTGIPLDQFPHRTQRIIPNRVREVLRACLQRKPEHRPSTAQLLAHPYVRGE
jgi:serine/threonine-protein kinase TTK/MPS1